MRKWGDYPVNRRPVGGDFVEKYVKEKVNDQHLLLNSAYVVVLIMSSNFLSYSSNYSVVKSHFCICLSAKTTILFVQTV